MKTCAFSQNADNDVAATATQRVEFGGGGRFGCASARAGVGARGGDAQKTTAGGAAAVLGRPHAPRLGN